MLASYPHCKFRVLALHQSIHCISQDVCPRWCCHLNSTNYSGPLLVNDDNQCKVWKEWNHDPLPFNANAWIRKGKGLSMTVLNKQKSLTFYWECKLRKIRICFSNDTQSSVCYPLTWIWTKVLGPLIRLDQANICRLMHFIFRKKNPEKLFMYITNQNLVDHIFICNNMNIWAFQMVENKWSFSLSSVRHIVTT